MVVSRFNFFREGRKEFHWENRLASPLPSPRKTNCSVLILHALNLLLNQTNILEASHEGLCSYAPQENFQKLP